MKRLIFGGTFNPPHIGHLNAVYTTAKKMGMDAVHIVPAAQNPLKYETDGPSPEERLEMVRLAFLASEQDKYIQVDDCEIKRGGSSYTVDTIRDFHARFPDDQLFLVLGADNLEAFEDWREPEEILKLTNLIFVSRPGWDMPTEKSELPTWLQNQVEDFDFQTAELKSGKSAQFLKLDDVEISASELRKAIRLGKNVEKFLPLAVEKFVSETNCYRRLTQKISDYKEFSTFCARFFNDKKAIRTKAFDLTDCEAPTDFTVICSATSTKHASALAQNLMRHVKEEYNVFPQSVEGLEEGRWVLIDYGSLIAHVFYDFVRQDYDLESLWARGKELSL